MSEWKDDDELYVLMHATLYTPVVGDILEGCGRFHQFLPAAVLEQNWPVFRCGH